MMRDARGAGGAIRAMAAGAALATTLCLAACGGGAATQGGEADASAGTAAEESAQDSTVATYGLTSAWVGMDGDVMTYYYESAAKDAGAVLVYYAGDSTYERWVGPMEASGEGRWQITDAETGETLSFEITPEEEDDTITIEGDGDLSARLSPASIDEVGGVLDEVDGYATRLGEARTAPSAAELGGEFLIRANAEGLGQVALAKGADDLGYGDSAFTHADAGDALTLSAQADDGWAFVRWTKDGEDLSTDATIEVTVDGDAEFVAVFEER